jgi:hypothetical protein
VKIHIVFPPKSADVFQISAFDVRDSLSSKTQHIHVNCIAKPIASDCGSNSIPYIASSTAINTKCCVDYGSSEKSHFTLTAHTHRKRRIIDDFGFGKPNGVGDSSDTRSNIFASSGDQSNSNLNTSISSAKNHFAVTNFKPEMWQCCRL